MKMPTLPNVNQKFGPKRINPGTGRLVVNKGKGGGNYPGPKPGLPMLPGRHALNVLSKGNPAQQSFQSYAKMTPSGAGAPMTYQGIMDMGLNGIDAQSGRGNKDNADEQES